MATHLIEKKSLKSYLDHFSKDMPTELVEIEVTGLDLGHQIEAEWAPMSGISYDPQNDVVSVVFDSGKLEHQIRKPMEFWVEEGEGGVKTMSIKCAEGLQHLIRLKEPKRLLSTGAK